MGYASFTLIKAAILKSTPKGFNYVIPFLNTHPNVMVVACSFGIDRFWEQTAGTESLDLILVEEPDDLGPNSASPLTALHQKFPQSAIIYFSGKQDVEHILWAIRAGASGYIPSGTKPKLFHQEFDRFIREGGLMMPPLQLLQILLYCFPHGHLDYRSYQLTATEICIIERLKRGYTPESMAASQQKDIHLIRRHLKHIFSKIDLRNCITVESNRNLQDTGNLMSTQHS